jgi:hypothetical protein
MRLLCIETFQKHVDPNKSHCDEFPNLTAICELSVWKMWEPRRLITLWASTAFTGIACAGLEVITIMTMNMTAFSDAV